MASRFSCSICLEEFTKPKLIDCHHTFCEKCLADHIRNFSLNNSFPCPMCRRNIQVPEAGVSGFSSNFYLEDILKEPISLSPSSDKSDKSENEKICDVCQINKRNAGKANFKCKQCKQLMCNDCKTTHDSFSGCFNHIVLSLDELSLFEDSHDTPTKKAEKIFCPIHSKDVLEFFCRDCWKTICYKCSATEHSGHKIEQIDEKIKTEAVKEVENLKHHIEYTKKVTEDYLNSLAFSISSVQLSTIAICEKIDNHVAAVCKEVKDAGQKMKEEIEKNSSESDNILTKLSKIFETFNNDLETSIKDAEKILATDSAPRIVGILPKLRQQIVENGEVNYVVPERKKVVFRKGSINPETVYQLLGRLDFRLFSEFQTSFNVEEVEKAEWGVSSQEFLLRNKVRCSISLHKRSDYCGATLSTNRQPQSNNNYPHELVPIPASSFILELANSDTHKSLMTRLEQAPGTENNMMHFLLWPDILEWKVLTNPDNGFIDENKTVTFRVMPIYKEHDKK